jgi:hypothetical protein
MKKFTLALILSFLPIMAFAQSADLSPPAQLSVPTAAKLQLMGRHENFVEKTMVVYFRFLDANGRPIYAAGTNGRFDNTWTCSDDPDAEPAKTCFSDVYGFQIRQQDVGVTLGKGTRALIIAKMKQDIPALAGVTITFGD